MQKADLSGCDVEGADFDNVDLKGAKLKALKNMDKANWKGSGIYPVKM